MSTPVATRRKKPADRSPAPPTDATQALAAPPTRELLEGPTREDLIRRRAFDLYERNGGVDGRALDDWLAAEAEVGRMVLEGTAPAEAGSAG